MPLRQTVGFVESLLKLIDPDRAVPDFSTLCRPGPTVHVYMHERGQKTLSPTSPAVAGRSAAPADPFPVIFIACQAVDSTGIRGAGIRGEGEGAPSADCCAIACLVISGTRARIPLIGTAFRLPGNGRSQAPGLAQNTHPLPGRRMVHSRRGAIDEQPPEIRAIEVTGRNVGDAPGLPDLLNQIPSDQETGSVTAPFCACRHALPGSERRIRHAQMPRCNCGTRCTCRDPAAQECEPVKARLSGGHCRKRSCPTSTSPGRALCRRWSGYHRRSRVETTLPGHRRAMPCRAADALH